MKFYFRGVIWDGANNKALCESENGEFETKDERIINELIKRGYPNEGKKEEVNKGIRAVETKTGINAELRDKKTEPNKVLNVEEKPKGNKKK